MYTYYKPVYNINKIEVCKLTYSLRQNSSTLFESKEQAIKAIEQVYQAAKNRFDTIKKTLVKLQNDLDFELSYDVEGDTHGVEVIEYIEFRLDGFVFKFEISF